MSKRNFHCLLLIAAILLTASAAFGQSDVQMHAGELPGWDNRAREGRCEISVWVDNRAELSMRGDAIFVRTIEGAKSRVEGNVCSQPLPYNSVRDFRIRQTAGRNRVTLAQEPSRMNNYTAMILLEDRQGGGDTYAFEVTWHTEADISNAPAAFFDDVRACQDAVRLSFLNQNGRGGYIDFVGFPDRLVQEQGRGAGQDQDATRHQGRNHARESIQGSGYARKRNESRDITYSCVIDTRLNEVVSVAYQYSSGGQRVNERQDDSRQPRLLTLALEAFGR